LLTAATFVFEDDRQSFIKEGELAQAIRDRGVIEACLGEDLVVRLEPDGRAGALCFADDLELLRRLAALERHMVALAIAVDPHLELLRECIDDGDADAMETTRHLVRALVELAARVQNG